MEALPFVIAAGGLTASDLNPWLDAGDVIAIGRVIVQQGELDHAVWTMLTYDGIVAGHCRIQDLHGRS